MNKTLVFENNLQRILDEKGLTQKVFAKMLGEREAAVSEFINLKRTTLNIDLLLKIASALNIKSLDELLSFKNVLPVIKYEQNKWYALSTNELAQFSYVCGADEESFEFVEIMENGMLVHQKYIITECGEDDVRKEFLKLGASIPNDASEDDMTLMLIEISKYKGKNILATRYKTVEEAKEVMDMLF